MSVLPSICFVFIKNRVINMTKCNKLTNNINNIIAVRDFCFFLVNIAGMSRSDG